MPVVARYKGYAVHRLREPNYKVLDGKEVYEVIHEALGRIAFRFTAYYNPRAKSLLTVLDKEEALGRMLEPAIVAMKAKIDSSDLTDGMLHVGVKSSARAASAPGGAS